MDYEKMTAREIEALVLRLREERVTLCRQLAKLQMTLDRVEAINVQRDDEIEEFDRTGVWTGRGPQPKPLWRA